MGFKPPGMRTILFVIWSYSYAGANQKARLKAHREPGGVKRVNRVLASLEGGEEVFFCNFIL
jgi:hypothetical protein